ncbi:MULTISPECIES: FMN-binding glutamate synthase family protein [unclassified Chelatococcus]|uniref:FMN-binding glutamate synthase family protein n=1 Tax=unclassified Chelatococcus TaxID=2638111 RepID=UPI001BD0DA79|nr:MULTISPECIES: FMN-binding glutamate synthase family protein [unclassified Chelatococcus]CAH1664011.1 Glutamate synthase domain-containing protein 2 [Hyphomicrobiales bacterium]MBS7741647.1 FMN-binding glutamate synthase family protein [Chelatococcus sp. HY11]MBX3544334.1 FMN-binding glutamate synthase family protein [Chelatococcus sp.]MCO5079142.1 FMN-binding glutamate synthase family protein [Chelatococcus sp.]CAH1681987.1 Glutamate synthase domain-containing protein 2 [Hyphomicrobiales ba
MKIRFGRYTAFVLCVLGFLAALLLGPGGLWGLILLAVFAGLSLLGVWDLVQTQHSVLRNYPVIGHVRWLVEMIRPEIRQYLLENETEAAPFSRAQRSLVYRRAKEAPSDHPFGTLMDVYANDYEFIQQSLTPVETPDPNKFRITIGNDQCGQPYSASIFNISAMSFGALSANAIRALNRGAALGGFYHDTGEGSISPYHRENGGDIVWQVASGYFGCRDSDGRFDPERFAAQARSQQVKMIELKLSQGAKPGHGGVLPGAKVTPEIAATRGVPIGVDCVSPARHSAFNTPLEMMAFLQTLRELSGGKPVGFKLCIGLPWEFMAIVKAMRASGIVPDFIVIDGGEGGTGAAPVEFSDHIGVPMREGLLFVHNTLVGAGLRDKVRIGVAGKLVSAFDVAAVLAIGADWVNSARGFMFALGCIQSLSCHTNRCPVGVATQDLKRSRALVVPDKAERVRSYHQRTVQALADMLGAAGLSHPDDLRPHHLVHRISSTELRQFDRMHYFAEPNDLIERRAAATFYQDNWDLAQAGSFARA